MSRVIAQPRSLSEYGPTIVAGWEPARFYITLTYISSGNKNMGVIPFGTGETSQGTAVEKLATDNWPGLPANAAFAFVGWLATGNYSQHPLQLQPYKFLIVIAHAPRHARSVVRNAVAALNVEQDHAAMAIQA